MTKFDLDTSKSLCKSIFDHWRKAAKTDINIGSNGDGSSLEVPRTIDLWEGKQWLRPLGYGVNNFKTPKNQLLWNFDSRLIVELTNPKLKQDSQKLKLDTQLKLSLNWLKQKMTQDWLNWNKYLQSF